MFESLWLAELLWGGVIGAAVAAVIGLLPRSKTRFWLIAFWSLLPATLFFLFLTFSYVSNPGDGLYAIGLMLAFCGIVLPPWLIITLLPFNLVRRVRELSLNPID